MKNQNKKLYIGIFIVIFLVFVSSRFSEEPTVVVEKIIITPSQSKIEPPLLNQGGKRGGNSVVKKSEPEQVPEKPAESSKNTEKITLILGENTLNLSFAPNTIFYDALVEWKNARTVSFAGKDYPSLGFFVTDIGALHSGNGKSLLYYINGKEATVGVSSYTLKDGDVIEWKLE